MRSAGLQPCSPFHHTPLQARAFITLRPRLPVRMALPPVCRPLFSAKSQPCPQLLPVVSGTLATAPRLLQKVSSLRPAKAAGFPVGAPLPPAAPASAQNQPFSAVQVFSEQVYSRGLFPSAHESRNILIRISLDAPVHGEDFQQGARHVTPDRSGPCPPLPGLATLKRFFSPSSLFFACYVTVTASASTYASLPPPPPHR